MGTVDPLIPLVVLLPLLELRDKTIFLAARSELESQPIHQPRQHYRIVDAATGLVEAGYVRVADMIRHQPWLDDTATRPVTALPARTPATPAPAALPAVPDLEAP